MSSTSTSRTNFLNVLAYIAVVAVGLALFISWVFSALGWNNAISGALQLIAECLAYIVLSCYSFRYARAKGLWWVVAWAVAVVLIVIFVIILGIARF